MLNLSRRRIGPLVAALALAFGVATGAEAQSKETAANGLKAFIEACVRTTPDFRNSAAVFKRRSMPVFTMDQIESGRVPKDPPALVGVLGPYRDSEIKGAKVCAVLIKGNFDRSAAATVEKYIADPSFPYQARIDGPGRIGNIQTSVFSAFPYGRNNVYAIVSTRGLAFAGYGRATMLMAMSGKLDMR